MAGKDYTDDFLGSTEVVESSRKLRRRLNPQHNAAELTSVEEGIDYVEFFRAALAACREARADRRTANKYAEQLVRHARETGRLVHRLPREQGKRTDRRLGRTDTTKFLEKSGYDKSTIMRWQALATRITDQAFNELIKELKADEEKLITLGEFYSLLKDEKKRARAEDLDQQAADLLENPPGLAELVADVVVVDPPWPYGTPYDPEGQRASCPYPEMSLEAIRDDVAEHVRFAEHCVLWLWTTHLFMRHSFPLLDAWGFEEKAIVTWVKDRMGLGHWLRSQSEFCILAVRGTPTVTLTNQTTVLNGPMREHSRKPDEFYALVEQLCHGVKIDFYAREQREGWHSFGNDTGRFA